MKPPIWKKWLSHFFEFRLESASSAHNPNLHVVLNRGRYQLCTDNAVYSFADLYDNFSITFDQLPLQDLEINNVLILGFGLGSIPLLLEKSFHKKYNYTAVEIDKEVLRLAQKYVLPELGSSINLICSNALTWVPLCNEKYDMIAMDIFLDDIIPDEFQQTKFLEQLEELLAPNGLLLYNRLATTKKDIAETKDFYNNKFKLTFEQATYLKVKGNWMLMNRNALI